MVNSLGNQYFSYNNKIESASVQEKTTEAKNTPSYASRQNLEQLSFGSFWKSRLFNNNVSSPDDKQMYSEIEKSLDRETKANFDKLTDTGIILQRNSNDGSSVLENLYKILKNPRHDGLETSKILSQTINTLANPHIITQSFGDIPPEKMRDVILARGVNGKNQPPENTFNLEDTNVTASSCCVAASVEFSLAHKKPAEFARMVEGLTSQNPEIKTKVQLDKITDKPADSLSILDDFKTDYKLLDWNTAEVTIKPDKNAIIRAQIQNDFKDPNERSSVDVMMQSALMNLGSEDAYNSLVDKRFGPLSTNNEGLTEFEKTFVETIVNNESKISLTYQIVDDNQRIVGYNYDFNAVQKQLIDSLNGGSDVIIGITEADESNRIIGGHEITVIGYQQDADGKVVFTVNDTDDDTNMPITVSASELIPKIHHAGIPTKLVNLPPQEEIGYQILQEYNNMKTQPEEQAGISI